MLKDLVLQINTYKCYTNNDIHKQTKIVLADTHDSFSIVNKFAPELSTALQSTSNISEFKDHTT